MKAFFAIVTQTVRSALRAKVFHILAGCILLAVIGLPLTVEGDGTLNGLVQISLTYSLGVVICLISAMALWISCSQISREMENYTMHLNLTKPCPRWKLWLGKWTGIFGMHALILFFAMLLIYLFIHFRVAWNVDMDREPGKTQTGELAGTVRKNRRFTRRDLEILDREIRVGRRIFYPKPEEQIERVNQLYKENAARYRGIPEREAKLRILNQLQLKDSEVPVGTTKYWRFENVEGKGERLSLRYRLYSGSATSMVQLELPCVFGVRDPLAPPEVAMPYVWKMERSQGGVFHEQLLSRKVINEKDRNSVTIAYLNPSKEMENAWETEPVSVVFQMKDGPVLMMACASFLENYARAFLLALLQIAFLTALGCTVSSAFSTPVATFAAVAYLIVGMSINAALNAPYRNDDGTFKYSSAWEQGAHLFARGVSHVFVSVKDLDAISDLSTGRLVENRRLTDAVLGLFFLRTGLLVVLGLWVLQKRELGLVVRK